MKFIAYPVSFSAGDTLEISIGSTPIYANSVEGMAKLIGMGHLERQEEWDDLVIQTAFLPSYPEVYQSEFGSKYIICKRSI